MGPPEPPATPPAGPAAMPGAGRTDRPVLVVVFATILIDFIGFSVLFPVLPLYAERLGASPHQVGAILTVYALAQLLFLPAWGWVSDRVGRRPVLLVSLSGTVASFVLLAFAESLPSIYVARALAGFFAASIGTAQAVVTDVTPPSERARGMGVIGAAFGLGMVVGPMLGGALAAVWEKLPFYGIAALAAANLVLAWLRLPETAVPDRSAPRWADLGRALVPTPLRLLGAVHDARIGLYLYLFFHLFTAFAVLESMITLYLGLRFGAGELDVALIFAWIGLWLTLTQGVLLGRLVRVAGERTLVAVGLLAMAAGFALVAAVPSLGWFYLIGPLIACGNGLAFPSFSSLYSQACRDSEAGELLAQSQSMATTGRVVGPVGAGLVMQSWTLGAPFYIAAALMLTGLLIFAASRRVLSAS